MSKSLEITFQQSAVEHLFDKQFGDRIDFCPFKHSSYRWTGTVVYRHRAVSTYGIVLIVKLDPEFESRDIVFWLSDISPSGVMNEYCRVGIQRVLDPDYAAAMEKYKSDITDSELNENSFNSLGELLGNKLLRSTATRSYYSRRKCFGADVMPIAEWFDTVRDGQFMEYDGAGYWMKDGNISDDSVWNTAPLDATHVAWYNK